MRRSASRTREHSPAEVGGRGSRWPAGRRGRPSRQLDGIVTTHLHQPLDLLGVFVLRRGHPGLLGLGEREGRCWEGGLRPSVVSVDRGRCWVRVEGRPQPPPRERGRRAR